MADLDLQFDAISYLLLATLLALILAPIVLAKDPDTHPYALLRQSIVSPCVIPYSLIFAEINPSDGV